MRRALIAAWIAIVAAACGYVQAAGPPAFAAATAQASQPPSSSLPLSVSPRSVLDRYCITCHNEKLRTAGLTLDTADVGNVGAGVPVWEQVVRKLRTGAMPPAGRPRPDQATTDGFVSWLETELDRAAAAAPNPGRPPAVRRLTRTEYQNAIRDLLALEHLPREMDLAVLLPADSSPSGFDNLADVLFVSPTLLEAYLSAGRKITRLAIGDPTLPLLVDTHTLPLELPQDVHVDGLPFGTRGGTVIRTHLPLDGVYVINIELAGSARLTESHQLEVSVDGERVQIFAVGAKQTSRGGGQYEEAAPSLHVRAPLKGGPRVIGVTFLQKPSAPGEELRRPYRRGRGQQPSVASVTVSGPYDASGVPDTPSRRRIFVCRPANASEEDPCVRQILSTVARRAHRRPVNDADLEMLLPFYRSGRAAGGFDAGIQKALERLLVSPEFLFRIEVDPSNVVPNSAYLISDLELASRLSFFLWSSIPDDDLLAVAAQGKLRDRAVLDQQVRRMLADPRSEALVTNFATQWLYLRDLEVKRPDDKLFPDFDAGLLQAFRRETEIFVDSVLREDRSVLDLLRANYTFVNERLAKHYGIPNVYGSQFRRVTLGNNSPRRGLLGQGSILTLTSYPTRTSPVLRGKWILENILSSPPPPPPPNVPALGDTSTEGTVLSMRERMEQHRRNPACASCHARMDPLGFALDNFDAVGQWRIRGESGTPIDASGTLPNGAKFEGLAGLREILLKQPEEFVITVTEKLLTYALGRGLEYYDQPAVRAITREAARSDYRVSSLILGIVESPPFQMRRSQS